MLFGDLLLRSNVRQQPFTWLYFSCHAVWPPVADKLDIEGEIMVSAISSSSAGSATSASSGSAIASLQKQLTAKQKELVEAQKDTSEAGQKEAQMIQQQIQQLQQQIARLQAQAVQRAAQNPSAQQAAAARDPAATVGSQIDIYA
jgi:TolA-binding protein